MSRINSLIKEKCSNGVKYKPLYEITIWDKKFNSTSKEMQPEIFSAKHVSSSKLKEMLKEKGEIKLLSTGLFDGYTTMEIAQEYVNNNEVITIPSGGTANIKYYNGLFVDSGNILAISVNKELYNLKYIYHYLKTKQKFIDLCFRGSGVKHPDMKKILNIMVPVPDIEVQDEIVKILDKFGELEIQLNTELELRKKQYDFWRNKLFEIDYEVEKLGNICELITKGTTPMSVGFNFQSEGINFIKIESLSESGFLKEKMEHISEECQQKLKRSILFENDILFSIAGAIGKVAVVTKEILPANTNQALAIIRLNSTKIKVNYLKHLLQSNYIKKQYMVNAKGSAQINLSLQNISDFLIPIPPLEEQEKVIQILDKFDKLVNDTSEGIPAEIGLRKKQYEYYRDKILSFEEV